MSMSLPEQSSGAVAVPPTDRQQRIARIAGVLWVLTFLTSIPAYLLYDPVVSDPGFITGDGSETRVLVGACLELFLIIANIGTAVVWFSIERFVSSTDCRARTAGSKPRSTRTCSKAW